MRKTNKDTNKDKRITIRLTPHLDFMLDVISKEASVAKSAIIRYLLNDFIKKYDNATE